MYATRRRVLPRCSCLPCFAAQFPLTCNEFHCIASNAPWASRCLSRSTPLQRYVHSSRRLVQRAHTHASTRVFVTCYCALHSVVITPNRRGALVYAEIESSELPTPLGQQANQTTMEELSTVPKFLPHTLVMGTPGYVYTGDGYLLRFLLRLCRK